MSEYAEGKLAGQRVITLLAELGAGAELAHVLAMGVPSIDEIESALQHVWARSSSGQPEARFVGLPLTISSRAILSRPSEYLEPAADIG